MLRGLTILTYHRVLPMEQCYGYPLEALVIPAAVFRQQMQWLAGHCRVLPVREAIEELTRGGPLTQPLVSVTFDDGYADNYEFAAPIMAEYDLLGTFFVTTSFVVQSMPLWFDRAAAAWQHLSPDNRIRLLARLQYQIPPENQIGVSHIGAWMTGLKQVAPVVRKDLVCIAESFATGTINHELYRPMTSDQVTKLHEYGHEIASHTVTHPILPQLEEDTMLKELKGSAEQLRQWTGSPITGFCYPNGDFDERTERAVVASGYGYACTTKEALNLPGDCPTRLARLPVTMSRTMRGRNYDRIGFRAELCRLRTLWRW